MKMKNYFMLFILFAATNCFSQVTWETIYKVRPNVQNCQAGVLNDSEKSELLLMINYIRSLHKMQPLQYISSGDEAAQQASLIMTANAALNHEPPQSYSCYSQTGYDGASSSNLFLYSSSAQKLISSLEGLISWLMDTGVESLGHRRSVINPFVNGVAFGRVDGNPNAAGKEGYFCTAMAMKYDYLSTSAVGLELDYVAYPYKNYHPALFQKDYYLSFSAVPDKNSLWANQAVDFSGATVAMKDESGKTIAVNSVGSNNEGWGSMPNVFQWKAAGLVNEMQYEVEIKNVKFKGEVLDYSYWFKLTEEVVEEFAAPVLSAPSNNSIDLDINPTFSWSSVADAESYVINLSETPQFESLIYSDNTNSTSVEIDNLENLKTYYWRVRAIKGEVLSEWSSTWKFTTKEGIDPTPVVILAPVDKMKEFDLLGSLIWSGNPNAVSYDWQLNSVDNFDDVASLKINKKYYNDTIYQFKKNELVKGTEYFWRVRPKFDAGNGEWASVHSFTTANSSSVSELSLTGNISNLAVMPNPVDIENLSIKFNSAESGKISIMICSIIGKTALSIENFETNIGTNILTLPNSRISNGSYWLIIKDETNNVSSLRFIVKR